MVYRMQVAGLWRELPICPVSDTLSIAGFVIFGDQELTVACAKALLERAPEYDYIITAEAKGIPLGHEIFPCPESTEAVYDRGVRIHCKVHHHRQRADPVFGHC